MTEIIVLNIESCALLVALNFEFSALNTHKLDIINLTLLT